MALYLGIVSCILLALVVGLLLIVGRWLHEFRQSYKQMPMLGEELTRQLINARDALVNLQKTAKETGPELARQVTDAQKLMQDLRFLMGRGEEVATRLESSAHVLPKAMPRPVVEEAVIRQVAMPVVSPPDNAVVVQRVMSPVASSDPLEELLAGLSSSPPVVEPPPALPLLGGGHKEQASVPEGVQSSPSQAEIMLRRTLAG